MRRICGSATACQLVSQANTSGLQRMFWSCRPDVLPLPGMPTCSSGLKCIPLRLRPRSVHDSDATSPGLAAMLGSAAEQMCKSSSTASSSYRHSVRLLKACLRAHSAAAVSTSYISTPCKIIEQAVMAMVRHTFTGDVSSSGLSIRPSG